MPFQITIITFTNSMVRVVQAVVPDAKHPKIAMHVTWSKNLDAITEEENWIEVVGWLLFGELGHDEELSLPKTTETVGGGRHVSDPVSSDPVSERVVSGPLSPVPSEVELSPTRHLSLEGAV